MTFCVENLNTIVDHPGVPLARAKDTLALVEAVGHPNVKMMLDLYHAQIGEGTSSSWCGAAATRSARSRSPTCRGAASRAPARSTTAAIAKALRDIGFAEPSAWRRGRPATADAASRRSERVQLMRERTQVSR